MKVLKHLWVKSDWIKHLQRIFFNSFLDDDDESDDLDYDALNQALEDEELDDEEGRKKKRPFFPPINNLKFSN